MLILPAALAALAALLSGGRLKNIETSGARGFLLPAGALLLKSAASALCATGLLPRRPYFYILLTAAYALCFAFVALNRRSRLFAALFGAGALANFAVIAANDFYMPVGARLASLPGFSGIPAAQAAAYRLADGATRLRRLGDVIYIPLPLVGGFASAGDVLMAAGLAVFVFRLLRPARD